MRKIKDIFSYSQRYNSVGINCVYCVHCNKKGSPDDFPTDDLKCKMHNISLNVELSSKGKYKSGIEGEWFCKSYTNRGDVKFGAASAAIQEFKQIQSQLEEGILYEACGQEYLCMIPFGELEDNNV